MKAMWVPETFAEEVKKDGFKVDRHQVQISVAIKAIGLFAIPVVLHPEVKVNITINVARSEDEAERQARGEQITVREETSMDDLGLEIGAALAEAGDVEL